MVSYSKKIFLPLKTQIASIGVDSFIIKTENNSNKVKEDIKKNKTSKSSRSDELQETLHANKKKQNQINYKLKPKNKKKIVERAKIYDGQKPIKKCQKKSLTCLMKVYIKQNWKKIFAMVSCYIITLGAIVSTPFLFTLSGAKNQNQTEKERFIYQKRYSIYFSKDA